VLNIALNKVINTEVAKPWYPKKDSISENEICSGGHNPTTIPITGSTEIKNTSNHPLASPIRRIVAAMRPQ
jgi:hypothetical protein